MKDMHNHLSPQQTLIPAVRTAIVDGAEVDLAGFEGAMFTFDMGTFGGTTPTMTLVLEESDTSGSGYTAVAAADYGSGAAPAQITDANDNQIIKDSYIGSKRYLRLAITAIGGTAPSLPCCGSIVKGYGRHQPVT